MTKLSETMSKKTDNANMPKKLAIRRYMLDKYHQGEPLRVFDCCQGEGKIWGVLRNEYEVQTYWGVDVKPKRGRLKIDSIRILQAGLKNENVVDIDTYGEPWNHYAELCDKLVQPTTVFLTCGIPGNASFRSQVFAESVGFGDLKIPGVLHCRANRALGAIYALTRTCGNCTIVEAVQCVHRFGSQSLTRYFGVRLEPNRDGATPPRKRRGRGPQLTE